MQVLLVEPDKVLANTYKHALKYAGHDVTWVSSAQDAIAQVDKKTPDCIILEVQLTGHNGIEFLFELRSYTDLHNIPVILNTLVPEHDLGLTDSTKQQLGIAEYLYKPHASLRTLQKIVEHVRV